MKNFIHLLVIGLMVSCGEKETFDLQGHRGARGLMPENTIDGFLHALEYNVTTLELDVVISKDRQVVVSHEPFMSGEICMTPRGDLIPEEKADSHNIYRMDYQEVKEYDCGSLAHPRFPEQTKISTFKPRLVDVFNAVDNAEGGSVVNYNVELKSSRRTDTVYHPEPNVFSDLVFRVIDDHMSWERVTIQSFDFRILQYFHEKYPSVRLALLIENELLPAENLDSLGFIPDIYSPWFKLLSREVVHELHSQGLKVIPWTVNEKRDMRKVISWGVDGLITDYPDRFMDLKDQ